MIVQPNIRLVALFESFSRMASAVIILVGCLVLVGWMFDITVLKSVFPSLVTMKANTALAFALAGVSLWLFCGKSIDQRTRSIAQACAVIVSLIGLLTLTQYLSGRDLGIDQLLFQEPLGAVGTSSPGRMAPTSALSFLFAGLALLSLDALHSIRGANFFTMMVGLIGLLNFVGYTYGVRAFYAIASHTQMAVHTAMLFLVLSLGIFSARPNRGLMAVVTSDSWGGAMARRLLPTAIGIPFLSGWLRLAGERAGLYNVEFGLALFMLLNVVIFTLLIWFYSFLLDRTDAKQKQSEKELREMSAALANAAEGISRLDTEGRYLSVNQAYAAMLGYTQDEMMGMKWERTVSLKDREQVAAAYHQMLATGKAELEARGLRKDGTVFHKQLVMVKACDKQQNFIGHYCFAKDITERKTVEQHLAIQYAVALVIAQSNSFDEAVAKILQTICESLSWDLGAIWYVDQVTNVLRRRNSWHVPGLDFSQFEAVSRQITFSPGIGLPGRIWQTREPAWIPDVTRDANFPRASFAEKERLHGAFGFPIPIRGEIIGVMEFFSREIRQPDQKMLQMFSSVGSHIGQFMERRRLEELSTLKDQFVANVSHELRTPLTAIKEGISLFLDRMLGPLNEEQLDFLTAIDENADQLTELINNLLDLSKIEAGRIHLVRRKVSVNDLIKRALQNHRTATVKRTLKTNLASVSDVLADPNRILQVLGNLFSNAIKFTNEGGTIHISFEEQDGHVVVSVEDDGIGIAKDDLPKLFQKFSQVGEGEKRPRGTGLGLAFSKELVELHHGKIFVTSEPGKGSKFTFTLPIYTSQLNLEESFKDQIEIAKRSQQETIAQVVVDGKPFIKHLTEGNWANQEECFETAMEFIRKRVHLSDSVLFVEPHWVVILAATPREGTQSIIARLRSALREWALTMVDKTAAISLNFGTAIYPVDGADIQTLFAKATTSISGVAVESE